MNNETNGSNVAKRKGKWLLIGSILALLGLSICLAVQSATRKEGTKMFITREKASEIAQADAEQHYRDLSIYEIVIELEGENWRVDYRLKDPTISGGGPHYIISGLDGAILKRRYEQ